MNETIIDRNERPTHFRSYEMPKSNGDSFGIFRELKLVFLKILETPRRVWKWIADDMKRSAAIHNRMHERSQINKAYAEHHFFIR